MLFKSKSNKSMLKTQDFTIQNINALSNVLLLQQTNTKYISKQIKNQTQLSQKNQRLIDKSIIKIQDEAEALVRRYEQQKQINEKLQFLVKTIEEELYKAKLDKSIDLKANIETDKLLQCCNILITRQKDLQKIAQKINSSSYDLSKKLDSIRALRSQRTIFSTLFDKIERELCDLEHCYKVLVIERNIQQQSYTQSVDQFSKYQINANQQIQKLTVNIKKSLKQQMIHDQSKTNQKIHISNDNIKRDSTTVTTTFNQGTTQKETNQISQFNKEKSKQKKSKLQIDFQNLQRQKRVKTILNDLGISQIQEIPNSLQILQQNNQYLLKEATNIYESILQIEQKMSHLNKKKKLKKHLKLKPNLRQDKKQLIIKTQDSINHNRIQVDQFRQVCKILVNRMNEDSKDNENKLKVNLLNEEEEIRYLMGCLQKYFQNVYLQNKNYAIKVQQRDATQPKRLTCLLNNRLSDKTHMSIFQQQQFLDFAKINLQRLDRRASKIEK